jgi:SAM-dependent methyltransferase
MERKMPSSRSIARQIAQSYLDKNDVLGWFEALYVVADGNAEMIPWADRVPNPNLTHWLDRHSVSGKGRKALIIGCGLGDDAEEMTDRGFSVVAFDISETAVKWCQKRFNATRTTYVAEDLFNPPPAWISGFDFVVEAYTLQVLPADVRPRAVEKIAEFVAPGGTLIAIARGRSHADDPGQMPWPLTRNELAEFKAQGLTEISFEDFLDQESPPVRRFRAVFHR